MRLLIAFLVLAGISIGALGYFASSSKTQRTGGENLNRVDYSAGLIQTNKTNTFVKRSAAIKININKKIEPGINLPFFEYTNDELNTNSRWEFSSRRTIEQVEEG